MRQIGIHIFMSLPIVAVLAVVVLGTEGLPNSDLSGQWLWVAKTCIAFAVCTLCPLLIICKNRNIANYFYPAVIWSLIILGGIESVWGLRQIYGYASSNHSLYKLTGSFFNPGPYSGYLAMVFPICLNEWLLLKKKVKKIYIEQAAFYLSGGVMLLIICVLPAGMSRSAWLAATLSGLWLCSMHNSWGGRILIAWWENRKKLIICATMGFFCLWIIGAALFYLKKDSANGRLFMWKITCQAISRSSMVDKTDNFAWKYGQTQEHYFAEEDYTPQEELVAGCPEYAFNDYLQILLEWGSIAFLLILTVLFICLARGVSAGRWSACGGLISLMVFAFSSYPMQLPAFIVAFFFLLAACSIGRSKIALAIFALLIGGWGAWLWKKDVHKECKEWMGVQMLYKVGAYKSAKEGYEKLYPALKERRSFLFEYGHCLHKLNEYEASTDILKEALYYNNDPMILNIIGKNYQQQNLYLAARHYYIRSIHRLPGRIYPHYLLAKLYAKWNRKDDAREMAEFVLNKEPKVPSTAVKEMRAEMRKLLNNISKTK